MGKFLKAVPIVYAISILTYLLFFYFIYTQYTGVKDLSTFWNESSVENATRATLLAEIERDFGYVGFIHHFKNYVIRRSDDYFQKALSSYEKTYNAIQILKNLSESNQDLEAIETIENTLNEYRHKLSIAQSQSNLSTNELDERLRVNDVQAELALNTLRTRILPKLKAQQDTINKSVKELNKSSAIISFFIIPLFLFSNFLAIRLIRQLTSTKEELATIFDFSPEGILYVENNGKILKANKFAEQLFGYTHDEFIDLSIEDLVPVSIRKKHQSLRKEFSQKIQSKEMGDRNSKIQGIRKDGSLVDLRITLAANELNGVMRSVCVIKDITQDNELKTAAETDHLTSINNRRFFDEVLQKELARSAREDKPLSLLMIDLDHFKPLNDHYGHTEGDKALKAVSEYLQKYTRSYDHLARWGGDEFVILCPNMSAPDALPHADRIRSGFETLDFPWDQKLTLSVGVACTNKQNPMTAKALLEAADGAVYAAKQNGRNQVKYFEAT